MRSLLNALQEGRLIELPDNDKEKSLQYLATLIEAVPDFRRNVDFAGVVLAREKAANTAIGLGWACPHGRVQGEGELLCAMGWSPSGIDYGAPDGKPVHVVIMHYIPDSQKNTYLKEISSLAKAIQRNPALGELSSARELGETRYKLIDLLTAAMETAIPDVKARMIQLEAKQAVSTLAETLPVDALAGLAFIPLSVVIAPGSKPLALSQDLDIIPRIEAEPGIAAALVESAATARSFDRAGYRIIARSVTPFQPDRRLYDCIAVRLTAPRSG